MKKIIFIVVACTLLLIPQLSYSQLDDDCDTQPCLRVHYDDAGYTTWAGLYAMENQPLTENWHNTAFGHNAMKGIIGDASLGTGLKNTAFGANALRGKSVGVKGGVYNTALGAAALMNIDDGHFNTAVGASAMSQNTKGFFNVAVGLETLRGGVNSQTGNYNTALGTYSLWKNLTGSRNTVVGTFAGTAGSNPGNWFGYETHPSEPIRGANNETGNDNIFIGYKSGPGAANINSSIAIGIDAIVTADNQLVIGSNYLNNSRGLITDSYWGSGVSSDTPQDFTFNATGGNGTDKQGANIIIAGGKSTGSAKGGSIKFQTSSQGVSGSNTNAPVDRMVINSKGNVGIGTSDLANNNIKLNVYNAVGSNYIKVATGGEEAGLEIKTQNNNSSYIWQYASSDLRFWVNGNDRVIINHNGNVGVGTTSPQSSLQVEGYVQLAITAGKPPAQDCNSSTRGRMKVDSANELLYICMNSGWISK